MRSLVHDVMFRIASVPQLSAELQVEEIDKIQRLIDEMSLDTDDIWHHVETSSTMCLKRQRLDPREDDASLSQTPDDDFVSAVMQVEHADGAPGGTAQRTV